MIETVFFVLLNYIYKVDPHVNMSEQSTRTPCFHTRPRHLVLFELNEGFLQTPLEVLRAREGRFGLV